MTTGPRTGVATGTEELFRESPARLSADRTTFVVARRATRADPSGARSPADD